MLDLDVSLTTAPVPAVRVTLGVSSTCQGLRSLLLRAPVFFLIFFLFNLLLTQRAFKIVFFLLCVMSVDPGQFHKLVLFFHLYVDSGIDCT